MKRTFLTAGILMVLAIVAATASLAGGMKAFRGTVEDPHLTGFTAFTTTGGGGGTAAMVLEVEAQIEGIGQADVSIDASWQWSPGPYSADHPCALVNITPQDLPDLVSGDPAFTYNATVTITAKNGDQLIGNISGGSVCEVVVFGPGMSINQWLIAFEIDGAASTGKFAGDIGQGVVDFKFDSQTFAFVQPFQISLNR